MWHYFFSTSWILCITLQRGVLKQLRLIQHPFPSSDKANKNHNVWVVYCWTRHYVDFPPQHVHISLKDKTLWWQFEMCHGLTRCHYSGPLTICLSNCWMSDCGEKNKKMGRHPGREFILVLKIWQIWCIKYQKNSLIFSFHNQNFNQQSTWPKKIVVMLFLWYLL